jgi:hypothetical protein
LYWWGKREKTTDKFYPIMLYQVHLKFLTFLTSLSLYIFTIWKCIAYYFFCRDGIYFDKILVSEYKLFKRSVWRLKIWFNPPFL